jgi:hypothetical protein
MICSRLALPGSSPRLVVPTPGGPLAERDALPVDLPAHLACGVGVEQVRREATALDHGGAPRGQALAVERSGCRARPADTRRRTSSDALARHDLAELAAR